jgi:hypothetical protein
MPERSVGDTDPGAAAFAMDGAAAFAMDGAIAMRAAMRHCETGDPAWIRACSTVLRNQAFQLGLRARVDLQRGEEAEQDADARALVAPGPAPRAPLRDRARCLGRARLDLTFANYG